MTLGWRLRRFRLGVWALLCLPGGSLQGRRVRQLCPGLCAGPCDGEASPRGAPSGFNPHCSGKAAGKVWFLPAAPALIFRQLPVKSHLRWETGWGFCTFLDCEWLTRVSSRLQQDLPLSGLRASSCSCRFLKSTRLGQGPLLTHSWDPAHTYCPAVTLSGPTSSLLGAGTCSCNYRLNSLVEIPNFVF